jgi:hypothetical protein
MGRGSIVYANTDATFSPDRRYRYTLRRSWRPLIGGPRVAFVGLNPSTADHRMDDPTIRRCVRFASDWGFVRLVMLNLFAFRATDPRELSHVPDPVGFGNYQVLAEECREADLVVAAWGAHPLAALQSPLVIEEGWLGSFTVLGLTKEGHPRHPLYMKASAVPLNPLTLTPVDLPRDRIAA